MNESEEALCTNNNFPFGKRRGVSKDEQAAISKYVDYTKESRKLSKLISRTQLDRSLMEETPLAEPLTKAFGEDERLVRNNTKEELSKNIKQLLKRNTTIKDKMLRRNNTLTQKSSTSIIEVEEENFESPTVNKKVRSMEHIELISSEYNITFISLKRKFLINSFGKKEYLVSEGDRELKRFENVYDSETFSEESDSFDVQANPGFLIYPESNFKLTWDVLMLFITLYILFTLPLSIAFGYFEDKIYKYFDYGVDCLFIVDLLLNFAIPFYDDEENLITSRAEIANNYISSWFAVDFVSSIPVSMILEFTNWSGEDLKFSRFTRLTKLYKLLKFVKVLLIFKVYQKRTKNKKKKKKRESTFSDMNDFSGKNSRVLIFFFIFLIVAHILTCFWIFISSDEHFSWRLNLPPDETEDFQIYVHSLYFNLSTIFTVGYGDVVPVATLERFYCLFMMIFGVLIYSFSISEMSSILTWKDLFSSNYLTKIKTLDSIRKDFKLTWAQYDKIEKYVNYSTKINKKDNYTFILDLPVKLRERMLFYMYKHLINNLTFLVNKENDFIVKFLFMIKPYRSFKGEYIVNIGSQISEMFFVENGRLSLLLGPKYNEMRVIDVHKYESFGDVLILTEQKCPLNLVCKSKYANLFMLKKEDLETLKRDYKESFKENYAISSYNFTSIMHITQIKIDKIVKAGASSSTTLLLADRNIRERLVLKDNFSSDCTLASKKEPEYHKAQSLAKDTTDYLKGLAEHEYSDKFTKQNFRDAAKIISQTELQSKKTKLKPRNFLKDQLRVLSSDKPTNKLIIGRRLAEQVKSLRGILNGK